MIKLLLVIIFRIITSILFILMIATANLMALIIAFDEEKMKYNFIYSVFTFFKIWNIDLTDLRHEVTKKLSKG